MASTTALLPYVKKLHAQHSSDKVHVTAGEFQWPRTTIERADPYHMITWMPASFYTEHCGKFAESNRPLRKVWIGNVSFRPAQSRLIAEGTGDTRAFLSCAFIPESMPEELAKLDQLSPRAIDAGLRSKEPHLTHLLRRIRQEVVGESFARNLTLEGLSYLLIAEFARTLVHRDSTPPRGGLAPWQLRRVKELVEDGTQIPCRTEALANACGISAQHLRRCFKQSTGSTLHDYMAAALAARAARMLASESLSIRDIAKQVGFSSVSGFSTAFVRRYGMMPGAYRKQARAGHFR